MKNSNRYMEKKKSYWALKLLIVLLAYIAGAITDDWWYTQYYNARVKVATYIIPNTVDTINESIVDTVTKLNDDLFVPFIEKDNIKYVDIIINNEMTISATFDTGCSYGLLLTPNTYYKLVGKGIIEEDNFTNQSICIIADGSEIEAYHFMLPEFSIGNLKFTNHCAAMISSGNADIVGLDLWKDYKSYTIDNENKRIVFTK